MGMELNMNGKMREELLKLNNLVMLGKLGSEDYPISVTQSGDLVRFKLNVLSEEPQVLQQFKRLQPHNCYVGLDIEQPSLLINDLLYSSKTADEKIDFWNQLLRHKLIIFKLKIKAKLNDLWINLEILSIENQIADDVNVAFSCIPNMAGQQDIEQRLTTGDKIILKNYPHNYNNPNYIRGENYIYYGFSSWERHENEPYTWSVPTTTEIMRIDKQYLKDELDEYIVGGTEDVEFFNVDGDMLLRHKLQKYGEVLTVKSSLAWPNIPSSQSVKVYSKDGSEHQFLRELHAQAIQQQLNYKVSDLVNFHTSVKVNPITVIAGMSGTGKTQLAQLYTKVLGLSEENETLLFLPITPSYLEPTDIIGYFNSTTQSYIPAETGLLDLLLRAEQHPNELHVVIFDEMNLSQVEYWFAPFLSLLEVEPEKRTLKLYSNKVSCQNGETYPPQVKIGENIAFIGTVNLDETTKEFSDRVLDRMNVVTLQKGKFVDLLKVNDMKPMNVTFSYEQYKSWIEQYSLTETFTEDEFLFFDELDQLIEKYAHQKGISQRFISKLCAYIKNLPTCPNNEYCLTKDEAIDLGVTQRLLTKLKGSERQLGMLIGTTESSDEEPTNSELLQFVKEEKAQSISSFKRTQQVIKRKALELGIYGYTS